MHWLNPVTGPVFIAVALVIIGVVLERFERRDEQEL